MNYFIIVSIIALVLALITIGLIQYNDRKQHKVEPLKKKYKGKHNA